jgi:hypothetical protein
MINCSELRDFAALIRYFRHHLRLMGFSTTLSGALLAQSFVTGSQALNIWLGFRH